MNSGKIGLLFCLLALAPSAAGATNQRQAQGTLVSVGKITATERDVIDEINLMRRDPARYARTCLAPMRAYYDGNLLKYPGSIPVVTVEGVSALDECIRELERVRPLSPLARCQGLSLSARDLTLDQGRTGATGHSGSDGSSVFSRMDRYGKWGLTAGENISYGFGSARKIVAALLIDDGVSSRGHRKNLLNDSFKLVGVDLGPHSSYGSMCVIDFAGKYTMK